MSIRCGVFLALAFLAACSGGGDPIDACPTDAELLKRFTEQEALFEALAANPGDEATQKALGIEEIRHYKQKPVVIRFRVWFHDFFGPGGCTKGYVWREEAPAQLVDSIDEKIKPGAAGTVEVYRAIKGKWYLYYQSAD